MTLKEVYKLNSNIKIKLGKLKVILRLGHNQEIFLTKALPIKESQTLCSTNIVEF